ncbi:MAG TPA: glycosyltransferase family 87 protein [Gemmatimonadales bacterium]
MQLPRDSWPSAWDARARGRVAWACYALAVLWALAESLRALGRIPGVIFSSYVDVGNAVLTGADPYALAANTWPPFFLLISVPMAAIWRWSPVLALFLWQLLGVAATWGVVRLSVALFEDGPISFWPRDASGLAFVSAAALVPFAMTARLFQEHAQHTQINVQVLFLVLWSWHLFRRERAAAGGLALAVAASTKAVPALLLGYLLYKRRWRDALWTVIWLVALNLVLLAAVFGPAHLAELWTKWRGVAGGELLDPTPTYMNQSLLAALKRLLTAAGSARDPVAYNVAAWSPDGVRGLFVVLAGGAVLGLAWLFRRAPGVIAGRRAGAELAVGLAAMTVVDPLAWKAHYVTLITAYAFCWWALRRGPQSGARWALWWGSFACLTLSAAAVWGGRISHILESADVILIGALLLLALAVWLLADWRGVPDAPSLHI